MPLHSWVGKCYESMLSCAPGLLPVAGAPWADESEDAAWTSAGFNGRMAPASIVYPPCPCVCPCCWSAPLLLGPPLLLGEGPCWLTSGADPAGAPTGARGGKYWLEPAGEWGF